MELSKTTWNVLEDASKKQLNKKSVQNIATKTYISENKIASQM